MRQRRHLWPTLRECGYTQSEIAAWSGASLSVVKNVTAGRTGVPK